MVFLQVIITDYNYGNAKVIESKTEFNINLLKTLDKDILIIISNSGETTELKNIIQFANRNKVLLIGIVSKNRFI